MTQAAEQSAAHPQGLPTRARLIGLDWGTSSLRAYLFAADGSVIDDVALPWGIMATPDGDFAKALQVVTDPWRRLAPALPMIAAGMIGSAQGWREIPYCPCPAGLTELVAAIGRQSRDIALPIVPGVAMDGEVPGVIRGEETQIVGALDLRPELAEQSLLVLPGTHSKWVHVERGAIRRFTTYLTGELFAALSKHTILGRPAHEAKERAPVDSLRGEGTAAEAFDQGVLAIRRHSELGLSPLLFSARTLVLAGRLRPEVSLDYLSGLLIGEELRCALGEWAAAGKPPMALIGESSLCARYRRALEVFEVAAPPTIGGASPAGLWRIAMETHRAL